MKRKTLFLILLVTLGLWALGGGALAAGNSQGDPFLSAENQPFTVTLEPGYAIYYCTFTAPSDYLYAIELSGNCTYYLGEYAQDWTQIDYQWFYEGDDRYVLGELAAGETVNFMIMSYQDPLEVTVRITRTAPFSYELLDDGTASITGFSVKGDIVIPSSIDGHTVTNLAAKLFYGRYGITSVWVPATVTYFGDSKTSIDFDYVFSYCYELERITVDPGNQAFKSVDGVLYTKDGKHLVNYPCARAGESYHTGAEVLSCTSFASCANLKHLYLDNSGTYWMGYTFYNTGDLTTLYHPGGYCEERALAFIDSHSGDDTWCAFRKWDPNLVPDMKLPARLTTIESGAFAGVKNAVIGVPDTVTTIADDAFDPSVTLYCSVNTAAERYCLQKWLEYIVRN